MRSDAEHSFTTSKKLHRCSVGFWLSGGYSLTNGWCILFGSRNIMFKMFDHGFLSGAS